MSSLSQLQVAAPGIKTVIFIAVGHGGNFCLMQSSGLTAPRKNKNGDLVR